VKATNGAPWNTHDAWSLTAELLRSSLARSRYGCQTLGPRLDATIASARAIVPGAQWSHGKHDRALQDLQGNRAAHPASPP
jgi:hypothetical protein